jgi:hypothetical protein
MHDVCDGDLLRTGSLRFILACLRIRLSIVFEGIEGDSVYHESLLLRLSFHLAVRSQADEYIYQANSMLLRK